MNKEEFILKMQAALNENIAPLIKKFNDSNDSEYIHENFSFEILHKEYMSCDDDYIWTIDSAQIKHYAHGPGFCQEIKKE